MTSDVTITKYKQIFFMMMMLILASNMTIPKHKQIVVMMVIMTMVKVMMRIMLIMTSSTRIPKYNQETPSRSSMHFQSLCVSQ